METTLESPRALATPARRPLAIANWLMAVAAMVFLMVVVGGITRLTESGWTERQNKNCRVEILHNYNGTALPRRRV